MNEEYTAEIRMDVVRENHLTVYIGKVTEMDMPEGRSLCEITSINKVFVVGPQIVFEVKVSPLYLIKGSA